MGKTRECQRQVAHELQAVAIALFIEHEQTLCRCTARLRAVAHALLFARPARQRDLHRHPCGPSVGLPEADPAVFEIRPPLCVAAGSEQQHREVVARDEVGGRQFDRTPVVSLRVFRSAEVRVNAAEIVVCRRMVRVEFERSTVAERRVLETVEMLQRQREVVVERHEVRLHREPLAQTVDRARKVAQSQTDRVERVVQDRLGANLECAFEPVLCVAQLACRQRKQALQVESADVLAVQQEDSIDQRLHRVEATGLISRDCVVVKLRSVVGVGWRWNGHGQ
ncbi:hypothetical protein BN2475_70050 [Paraburkholderia ribeironis]|uniref:Uncharacterized protein n=1 Tax=Paraburkholderia ribeironis TaxID=1247936 RepID=A0A1N7RLW5_9BURK|nr:hypothetical protein BN2475_70050 [Paraburkholderia ribeironis]